MAILQSCCCWRSLRKGSYASATYTLFYYGFTATVMARFIVEEQQYWSGNSTVPKSNSFLEPGQISHTTMIFNVIVLGCSVIGILTSFTLICGLYTDTRVLLLPWMLSVVTTIVVDLTHSVYLFVLETLEFEPLTAILFTTDFFLLSLNIYCFLCVVSQYQEYKEGRGTADFEFINRRVPGVRYVPQPTGTSFLSTRRAVTYQETKASPTCSPPGLTEKTPHRKHVQFGELSPPPYEEVVKQRLAPPQQQQPSSIIHIESPKAGPN
ncbi:uncharacterized protein isoform X2 [Rhodnius prolixus]|uniref:uncharacterized protein isoform X2 n=1 Tax=Rhodnius prolixus TaxID=13249 RepID=UPI003D18F66E